MDVTFAVFHVLPALYAFSRCQHGPSSLAVLAAHPLGSYLFAYLDFGVKNTTVEILIVKSTLEQVKRSLFKF